MTKTIFVGAGLAVSCMLACAPPTAGDVAMQAASTADGSGNSSSSDTVSTTIDTTLALKAVTQSDLNTYCDDVNTFRSNHVKDLYNESCMIAATVAAYGKRGTAKTSACSDKFSSCESEDASVSALDCLDLSDKVVDCTATVQEFSQCEQDTMLADRAINGDTCKTIADDQNVELSKPASCQALTKKCPKL